MTNLHKGELYAYRRRASMRMASHLQLTVANISPTLTLAPQLLSKDVTKARKAAVSLERRLVEIPVGTGTPFEEHLRVHLMDDIASFANCALDPPVTLWRNGAAWAKLFKFLAARYLANLESALDCESIHAMWK